MQAIHPRHDEASSRPFDAPQDRPWFREPWVWFLAAGPIAVIVAGIVTVWLAVSSDDGLVVDDYYRKGLAINQTLGRDRAAADLGMRATLAFLPAQGSLRVDLGGGRAPAALQLRISHPTRAGRDQLVALAAVAPGAYQGAIAPLGAGRWLVLLEDTDKTWRLMGEWQVPGQTTVTLAPAGPAS
ncbi:MAG: FixH family protein [Betaproteobacteria bacterium]|nr:FixH family protein [Betaproteobacteria bacterium]